MSRFGEIRSKVAAGERLDADDALVLYREAPLLELGELARSVKEEKTGNHVYFNVNRHLNLTNVCRVRCAYCSFRRSEGEEGAYVIPAAEAVRLAKAEPGLTELHIVNGLHPTLPLEYYEDVLRALKGALPDVHLKGFTAVEIDWYSKISGLDAATVLERLVDAGLGSLPGGGAEIFDAKLRRRIIGHKCGRERWLEIHRIAHEMGLRSTSTMLWGHLETYEHRVDHMLSLRGLQDETGGFTTFIPLRFQNENNRLSHLPMATSHEQLRNYAVSRLLFDNVDHIKAYWVMTGIKVAQLSLEFGVDDIDGTVVEERIGHDAGARTPQALARDDLIDLVREAGRTPVERDTVYNIREVFAA